MSTTVTIPRAPIRPSAHRGHAPGARAQACSRPRLHAGRTAGVYTNRYVPPSGGLTIRKLTTGGVGRFGYTVTPVSGHGSVRLARATTTQPNIAVDAQPSLLDLAPGRYRISESKPASSGGDWRLVRVRCDGASRSTAQPVEVDIPAGGAVTCTFINAFVPKGSIALAKITEGGTGTASFLVFPAHGSAAQYRESATTTAPGVAVGAAPDSAADATDHLPLGAYWIVEQPPAGGPASGWTLTPSGAPACSCRLRRAPSR